MVSANGTGSVDEVGDDSGELEAPAAAAAAVAFSFGTQKSHTRSFETTVVAAEPLLESLFALLCRRCVGF
jgi:hypothetical protein